MKTLSIIGCGKVGKTLGRLWAQAGVFRVHQVLNRTLASAEQAVQFIGSGTAITAPNELTPADVFMITTLDSEIEAVGQILSSAGLIKENTLIFHCSGALPASLVRCSVTGHGLCASVHPIMSFASEDSAFLEFKGTPCAIEGNTEATEIISAAILAIGGHTFRIEPGQKLVYHAALVFASNYLNALMEVSIRTLQAAGVPEETGIKVIEPLARKTLENIIKMGTASSLTGPISRGEGELVRSELAALSAINRDTGDLYRALGRVALSLATVKGEARAQDNLVLERLLAEPDRS